MEHYSKFQVKPGGGVDLGNIDAGFRDKHESHEYALPELETYRQKLRDLQSLMYPENKCSLLICLLGRDAACRIRNVTGSSAREDYTERPLWGACTEAFEVALAECSTAYAPWFIIPAKHRRFRSSHLQNRG